MQARDSGEVGEGEEEEGAEVDGFPRREADSPADACELMLLTPY